MGDNKQLTVDDIVSLNNTINTAQAALVYIDKDTGKIHVEECEYDGKRINSATRESLSTIYREVINIKRAVTEGVVQSEGGSTQGSTYANAAGVSSKAELLELIRLGAEEGFNAWMSKHVH